MIVKLPYYFKCILISLLMALTAMYSHAQDLRSLVNDFDMFCGLGLYEQAIEVGNKLLAHLDEESDVEEFCYVLNMIARCHFLCDNYKKAIELGTKTLQIANRVFGERDINFITCLDNLAKYYFYFGDNDEAIKHGRKVMELAKLEFGEVHTNYAISLENLANYYSCGPSANYAKTLELREKAVEIRKLMQNEDPSSYTISLDVLAHTYDCFGDYDKAIRLGTEVMGVIKQRFIDNTETFIIKLDNLAQYYSSQGDSASSNKAQELRKEAMEFFKQTIDESDLSKAALQTDMPMDCFDSSENEEVIEFGAEKIKQLSEIAEGYAISLVNLAQYYTGRGDSASYVKAVELGEKGLDILKQSLGEDDHDYAVNLSHLSGFYFRSGNYTKAIELGEKASEVLKINDAYNYAATLGNLACYYAHLGCYSKAIELYTKSIEIEKQMLNLYPEKYALSLTNLARVFFESKQSNKAVELQHVGLGIYQKRVFQSFSNLTSKQLTFFWNRLSFRFQEEYPLYVSTTPTDSLVGDLYDKSCLFAKGMLLSAETEIRKLILESGDSAALVKFKELQSTRAWLNKLYEKPIAERHVNAESLETVAEKLETELVQASKTYGDFMHNLKLNWRDVQAKLGDKDIAVEFLSFPMLKSDTIAYIALTLRKGYESPHLVKLFNENELKSITSGYYTSKELSLLIWGRLKEELNGVENIYFSPSGELYNIAIESMPHWEQDCMMSDRFNLYRLSSTRELAIARDETPSSGAVIYGGIKYDSDVASMGAPKSDSDQLYAVRGFEPDSTAYRGTKWEPLPGTLAEANAIYSILGSSKASIKTGVLATETSFKDLSGKKKQMLHIATHGFYWSESLADYKRKAEQLSFLQAGEERQGYVEDKAMTRTGLLFAGAQNTFNKVKIPAGVDDGVLTAQEIAQLDLRGLDLVVLSACQTGLGEINGDGVFGLQRGFKKAGARSIMMSLWSVNDEATKDLMTQFYTALAAGKSKRESFLKAQQYVKEHDKDYKYADNEKVDKVLRSTRPHWAAFILLDATDKTN